MSVVSQKLALGVNNILVNVRSNTLYGNTPEEHHELGFEVWLNIALKNNTIRCKKLATIVSDEKNIT